MLNPVVLYVEDEPDDVFLMRRAFQRAGLEGTLHSVGDGMDAIKYLAGENSYGNRERYPFPTVVLLDLSLPGVNGFDVMEWMRGRAELRELPVVIFSSSGADEDKTRAAALGAREFIEKPNSGQAFNDVVKALREKWLG